MNVIDRLIPTKTGRHGTGPQIPDALKQKVANAKERFDQAQKEIAVAETEAEALTKRFNTLTLTLEKSEDKCARAKDQFRAFQDQRQAMEAGTLALWGQDQNYSYMGITISVVPYRDLAALDVLLADFKSRVLPALEKAVTDARRAVELFNKKPTVS